MKRSKRLSVIVDLQQSQENSALQFLGSTLQRLQAQQQQLDQLRDYRASYLQSFAERQAQGMNVGQMLEFRVFAEKLDKAILGQEQALQTMEQDVARARQNWQQCHQRTQSLQKVTDKAVQEELRIEDKREQAEMDARAGRKGRKV
jgi:flagellar protein FliJ